MKILALDCGKNKSVFLDYQTANGPKEYGKVWAMLRDGTDWKEPAARTAALATAPA
jgi:hypothetical protein